MIWDNGSTDGTREYLLKEWADKAELVFSDNVGITGALNAFFRIHCPRAEFVANVDNDTIVPENWTYDLIGVAEKYNLVAVQGTHQVLGRPDFFNRLDIVGQYKDKPVYRSGCMGASGAVFRSSFVYENGLIQGAHHFDAIEAWYSKGRRRGRWVGFSDAVRLELLDMNEDATKNQVYPEYNLAVAEYRRAGC